MSYIYASLKIPIQFWENCRKNTESCNDKKYQFSEAFSNRMLGPNLKVKDYNLSKVLKNLFLRYTLNIIHQVLTFYKGHFINSQEKILYQNEKPVCKILLVVLCVDFWFIFCLIYISNSYFMVILSSNRLLGTSTHFATSCEIITYETSFQFLRFSFQIKHSRVPYKRISISRENVPLYAY